MRHPAPLLVMLLAALAGGCAQRVNPSFAVTDDEAERDLERMADEPVTLDRPVVVVGGLGDVGLGTWWVREVVTSHTGDDRVVGVTFALWQDMEDARRHLIAEAHEKFGDVEVDVVAMSMGGVIARDAAVARGGEPVLRIARLFTIASPHAGARVAAVPGWMDQHLALREGSDYLAALDGHFSEASYQLYAYTRLRDRTVGERFTAPPGESPRWVDNPPFQVAHYGAFTDDRILADILRRLRNESPWSHDPPAPLPID